MSGRFTRRLVVLLVATGALGAGILIGRAALTAGLIGASEPAGTPGARIPDARTVQVSDLLRPESGEVKTLYGDLDGRPPGEIVVHSVAERPEATLPQNYLDVFAWRDGQWIRALDATTFTPPGEGRPLLSEGDNADGVGEEVTFLELVDFHGDGVSELVVGVQWIGASTGPFTLWVLSASGAGFAVAFEERTTRGVESVSVHGGTVELLTGAYYETDPMCCPTRRKREVIGAAAGGPIRVLSRAFEFLPARSPEAAALGLYRAWAAGDREAALAVAAPEVVDDMFAVFPNDPTYGVYFTDDELRECEGSDGTGYSCVFFHDGAFDLQMTVARRNRAYRVESFFFAGTD
jgi:hypothetical protein